jgi:ribonuclease HII
MKIMDIDEVRKSPVIGSIILCGFICDEDKQDYLHNIGVKDSKKIQYKISKLSKYLRNDLSFDYKILKIPAIEISKSDNINKLEASYISKLIKWGVEKHKVQKIYIDSLTAKPSTTGNYLNLRNIKGDCIILTEVHADEIYPCVSAASIIAKDFSDLEMKLLRKKYDFGSGECNDKKTREFIYNALQNDNQEALKIIRTNWETTKRELRKLLDQNDKKNNKSQIKET